MAEPELTTLQRWMSHVVRHPRHAAEAVKSRRAHALIPANAALAIVAPSDRMEPMQRVDVYGNAYVARLVGALRADFPGLIHALGDSGFFDLASAYVEARPSHHPNLIFLCQAMPAFIARRRHLPNRAFLRDLAQFEVAMTEAFHAPRAAPFDPTSLATLAPEEWETVVLRTDPSLRLLKVSYPVNGYLQSVLDGAAATVPPRSDSYLAVYRKDFRVWRMTMQRESFATLAALAAGEPFGAALQHAGRAAAQVGAWFQGWTADGLFRAN